MRQAVYLDLSPEMRRQLPASLRDLLKGQGVEVPTGVDLSEGPLPVAEDGARDKDWGIVINVTMSPEFIGALGASISVIILAISQFLKDRAHEPKVYLVDDVLTITAPDGTTMRRLAKRPVLIEPGPQLKAELEARLKNGKDVAVRFKLED